jgi:hypothetical protein
VWCATSSGITDLCFFDDDGEHEMTVNNEWYTDVLGEFPG